MLKSRGFNTKPEVDITTSTLILTIILCYSSPAGTKNILALAATQCRRADSWNQERQEGIKDDQQAEKEIGETENE